MTRQDKTRNTGHHVAPGIEKVHQNVAARVTKHVTSLLLVLSLATCIRDLGNGGAPVDDTALVTLSLTMPSSPATRAMTEGQENTVDEVDVLLFSTTGDKLYYRAHAYSIKDAGANKREFTVRLPVGTYNAVIIANARGKLAGIPPATLHGTTPDAATGATRAAILDNLVVENIIDGKIPMWGYTNPLVIDETNPSPVASLDLTRAVARVDVRLLDAVTNFTLESVYLYNRYSAGTVTPDASNAPGNLDGYDASQWKQVDSEKKAIAPNIPAVAVKTEEPLPYNVATGTGPVPYTVPDEQKRAFTRAIYTFEAPAGDPVDDDGWEDNTCLVIGGKYTNDEGQTATNYYRVEFRSGTEPDYTYLPLLRNHLYDVVIQNVSAHGYPTPGDAYANKPANITATITEWNDSGLNDITFNDQYYLAVDKSIVTLYVDKDGNPAEYYKTVRVATNYPGGWTIGQRDDWIEFEPGTDSYDGSAGETRQKINLRAKSTSTGTDDGHFDIVVHNLKKTITVKRSTEREYSLELDPAVLVFYKGQTVAKSVSISAIPIPIPTSGGIEYVLTYGVEGGITWWIPTGGDFKNLNAVAKSISVLPAGNNTTGATLRSTITISLDEDPSGDAITRATGHIEVLWLTRPINFSQTLAGDYPAAAGKYTRSVSSEGTWRFALDNPADASWITIPQPAYGASYYPAAISAPYTFRLAANTGADARTATIRVESDTDAFFEGYPGGITFDITQAGASKLVAFAPPPYTNNTLAYADILFREQGALGTGEYLLAPAGDIVTVTPNTIAAAWHATATFPDATPDVNQTSTGADNTPIELSIPARTTAADNLPATIAASRRVTVTAALDDHSETLSAAYLQPPFFLHDISATAAYNFNGNGGTARLPVAGFIPATYTRVIDATTRAVLWQSPSTVGPVDGTALAFTLDAMSQPVITAPSATLDFTVPAMTAPWNGNRVLAFQHGSGTSWTDISRATGQQTATYAVAEVWQENNSGDWKVYNNCPAAYEPWVATNIPDNALADALGSYLAMYTGPYPSFLYTYTANTGDGVNHENLNCFLTTENAGNITSSYNTNAWPFDYTAGTRYPLLCRAKSSE
jgi:hypothetical protein